MPSELAVFECLPIEDWARNEHWECFVRIVGVDDGVGGEFIIVDSIRKPQVGRICYLWVAVLLCFVVVETWTQFCVENGRCATAARDYIS